ncbi:hypothetical protein HYT04_02870 [Candidatus Kaiserbacteria bacterium]|nr:hypothetical protein [Candidatus Kaiserbacteria bacterium]
MRAKQWRQGFFIGILMLVAFWLASLIWGLAGKVQIAVDEAHKAERRYKALEERKMVLEANLAALETSRGKDAAIRTAFGVARPGEEVIVVVQPAATATTTEPSWWEMFLSWF